MSESKYLCERRGRWLVKVAVPKDLHGRLIGAEGRPIRHIEKYLGTAALS